MRSWQLAGVLLLAASAALGQGDVLRVETNVVLVDTVVTDKKGSYVRDLAQKDFKVWEDDKEQVIRSFSFGADPLSPLNSQPRYLVLYFDNSTMNFEDQAQARKAAVRFIDANAGPNRLMAIVNFSGHLQIAQNFTADIDRLKAVASGARIAAGPSPNDFGLGRAAADFGARNAVLGIRSLAKSLAEVPGRKMLVLLTAGFPVNQGNLSEMTATIDMCSRSNVAIYPIDVRGLLGGSASIREGSPFMTVAYQRRGGTDPSLTPPMDPEQGPAGRLRRRAILPKIPEGASGNQQMMYMLANGTGGFVIVNTNDLLGGMQKIAKELNEFYLIGYTPPAAEVGSVGCHTIRVKVDHAGYTVRARTGYCTAKLQDVLAKTPVEKTLESHAAAAQAGDVAASMQTPYFFTASNVARVTVAMEIPAGSLKFEKDKGKLRSTLNILGIAYKKADGTVGARFSDAVKIDFDTQKQVEQFQKKLYHYEKEFKIVSGEYDLKVVFGAGGDSFGKIEQPLVIDAYDVKSFSVSALALSVQYRKTSDADQGLEMALLDDRTPLIADGFQLTPAGTAKFKKTDMIGMYFEIYEPALLAAEPAKGLVVGVQLRAFDAKGAMKFDSGGVRVGIPESAGNPSIPFAAAIPAETLETGTYKVEVTAMDSLNNTFRRTAIIEVR